MVVPAEVTAGPQETPEVAEQETTRDMVGMVMLVEQEEDQQHIVITEAMVMQVVTSQVPHEAGAATEMTIIVDILPTVTRIHPMGTEDTATQLKVGLTTHPLGDVDVAGKLCRSFLFHDFIICHDINTLGSTNCHWYFVF